MLRLVSTNRRRITSKTLISGAAVLCMSSALWAQAPVASAQTPANDKIPNLASAKFAWLAAGVHWFDPPAGLGRGPIRQDPAYPFHGNLDGPGQVTPEQIWMIWQRDHMVRRIYMTDKHSETVKPSWFGESIGHYDSDGTLVVNTIGLSARNSFLDWYRTPHTEKEHVVERFRLINNSNGLEVLVTVEDADTFNEPLHMIQRWRKVPNPTRETVCAENNGDHFNKNLFPIPQADKPDF